MSAVKHTPGPWSQYRDDPLVIVNAAGSSLGEASAGDPYISADEQLANARMFAAAPELLEALRDAIDAVKIFRGPEAWDIYWEHSPECKRWRAAIAKATGSAS